MFQSLEVQFCSTAFPGARRGSSKAASQEATCIAGARCEACSSGSEQVAAEAARVGLRCSSPGCSGAVALEGPVTQLTSLNDIPNGWLHEIWCVVICGGLGADLKLFSKQIA